MFVCPRPRWKAPTEIFMMRTWCNKYRSSVNLWASRECLGPETTAVNIQGFSLKQSERPQKQFLRQTFTINSCCQWEEVGSQLERVFWDFKLPLSYQCFLYMNRVGWCFCPNTTARGKVQNRNGVWITKFGRPWPSQFTRTRPPQWQGLWCFCLSTPKVQRAGILSAQIWIFHHHYKRCWPPHAHAYRWSDKTPQKF